MVHTVRRSRKSGTALRARRQAFRKALALAETTQSAWAVERGVTPTHLSYVLNGHRVSASLTSKIDAFIAVYLPAAERAA